MGSQQSVQVANSFSQNIFVKAQTEIITVRSSRLSRDNINIGMGNKDKFPKRSYLNGKSSNFLVICYLLLFIARVLLSVVRGISM